MRRRVLLRAGVAAGFASLSGVAGCTPGTSPPGSAPSTELGPRESAPPGRPVTGLGLADRPAEYAERLAQALELELTPTPEHPQHPSYAGAVVLTAVNGVITAHEAVGEALRYSAGPTELPPAGRVPMRPDSVFDTSSLTRLFTSMLVLQLADAGRLDLDAPLVSHLPELRGEAAQATTAAQVLAHTSGLPATLSIAGLSGAALRTRILTTPLVKGAVPGATFRDSAVGMMALGLLVERLTGTTLDLALRDRLAAPLGLAGTGYLPTGWLTRDEQSERLVATDARRRLLRGLVHDDTAQALGGVAGHAGIFSTARDLAVIGQMLLDGGQYGGNRLLAEATVRRMLGNANQGLPAVDRQRPQRTASHGLGVELDQSWFMGRLAASTTFGHTGFTGTALVVEPRRRLVLVLLTSRAHPDWTWANPDPIRVRIANLLADALP